MKPERTSARNMTRQKLWADIYTSLMAQRTALPLPMQQGEAERAADLALAGFDQRFPAPEIVDEDLNEADHLNYRRPPGLARRHEQEGR